MVANIAPVMQRLKPLTQDEFAALMADLGLSHKDGPFAIAVSGGPDSLALSLLMADWAQATYLTFDHGLRATSADEAKKVSRWLNAQGLEHHILRWEGTKPNADIQAAARTARYQALEDWCRKNSIKYLLLGHTMDDQAETFLIRLFRGSGVDGLSAMVPISGPNSNGKKPILVRPLLNVKKQRLIAFLKEKKQDWIEDPSNENLDFTRIKIRKLLASTNIKGLDTDTLAKTATRMGRVRKTLEHLTRQVLERSSKLFPEGYAKLDLTALFKVDEEIGLRALSKAMMMVAGVNYPPRLNSLERLYYDLASKNFTGATLLGCQFVPEKDQGLFICREPSDISQKLSIKAGQTALWDSRFIVSLTAGAGIVKNLGEKGWLELLQGNSHLKDLKLPYPAKLSLPALVIDGVICEVPMLGVFPKKQTFTARFLPLAEK